MPRKKSASKKAPAKKKRSAGSKGAESTKPEMPVKKQQVKGAFGYFDSGEAGSGCCCAIIVLIIVLFILFGMLVGGPSA
ncbi:hypothetical protein DRN67_03585 [Candidatus Micrarchaeota archaeon]|nr:MAG: hypothetical protein DRN67_03585 [Candidatus Micrarchaeota archaeon]